MKPETCALKLFQRLLRLRVNAEHVSNENLVTIKAPGFVLHVVYHNNGVTAAYPYRIGEFGRAMVLRSAKWKEHVVDEVAEWVVRWCSARSSA